MLDYLRDHLRRSAHRNEPFYGLRVTDVRVATDGASDHPVHVTLRRTAGETTTIRAKYIVGCDCSRSATREAIGRRCRATRRTNPGGDRFDDARPMHLGHAARADGAWRLYAFADLTDFFAGVLVDAG